jgi:hypothetical protein
MNITHFTMEEFLISDTAESIGANNYPTWEVAKNLERLATVMEHVRNGLGARPVTILSGYRSPPVNTEVGGATNSAHLYGLACDFVVNGLTPLEVCKAIEPHMAMLEIDQLIWEYGDWVHLGLSEGPARCQCLTINNAGTSEGFP